MGGTAFAQAAAEGQPTLWTTRIKPEDYARLKEQYTKELQICFPGCAVNTLKEAPGKTDFGDIDFVVAAPQDQKLDTLLVATRLGAKGLINSSGGGYRQFHLAVPLDGSKASSVDTRTASEVVVYTKIGGTSDKPNKQQRPSDTFTDETYVQLDIQLIRPEHMPWYSWYASYGDLGGILGFMARNLGLIVADSGLYLRLQELDDAKDLAKGLAKTGTFQLQVADKKGLVLLTEDSVKVMEFLGLSPSRFDAGFDTVEEMYEWLCQSRLATANVLRIKRDISVDRQKQNKRKIYSDFIDSWLPKHLGLPPVLRELPEQVKQAEEAHIRVKRQQLRDEALNYFIKWNEFDGVHGPLVLSINNQIAKHLLRPIIQKYSGSQDLKLAEINRAFGRWVGFDEKGRPFVKQKAHSDEESQLHRFLNHEKEGLKNEPKTDKFVREHWQELKNLERERAKALRAGKEYVRPPPAIPGSPRAP